MGSPGRERDVHDGGRPLRHPRRRREPARLVPLLKRVYTAANLPEAQLLADHLAERGVRARIFNANASSLAGELPIDASLPQVWVVDPADAERARGFIDEYLTASSGPPVRCPKCGEENPASFEVCWSCRTPLPHGA